MIDNKKNKSTNKCAATGNIVSTHRKKQSMPRSSSTISQSPHLSTVNGHADNMPNANYMPNLNMNEYIEAYSSSSDVRVRIMKSQVNLNATKEMSKDQLIAYLLSTRADLLLISKHWTNDMY